MNQQYQPAGITDPKSWDMVGSLNLSKVSIMLKAEGMESANITPLPRLPYRSLKTTGNSTSLSILSRFFLAKER